MSRCTVCDTRLNDLEFNLCKEICGVCQEIIDDAVSDNDGYEYRDFQLQGTEVPALDDGEAPPAHGLDYYDNLEYFDENQ